MAIMKFMLGNLKNRKSYSIIICVLVFFTGLILTATISTLQTAGKTYDTAFDNSEAPHIMYWMGASDYKPEIKSWLEQQPDVKNIKLRNTYEYNGGILKKDGEVLRNSADYALFEYNPEDNMRLIDATKSKKELLSQGEIYLPYVFKTEGYAKTGDKIYYAFGNNKIELKVAGFIEDPIAGCGTDGSKYLYISKQDIESFLKQAGKEAGYGIQIRVRMNKYDDNAVSNINKSFLGKYGRVIGSVTRYSDLKNNILILPNIGLALMIVFAVMLCIITIVIMRYAILATIEADYLNIGIVKALGFTPSMVQLSITGQYTLLATLSGVLSILGGIFVTPMLGQVLLKSSGLYFVGSLSLITAVLIVISLTLVISFFSFLTAGKTRKISPVRAIANGISPIYFSSKLNIRLEKIGFIPFNLRVALKQVLTKSKRYIILLIISAILAYSLVFSFGLYQLFSSEKALGAVGVEFSDIELDTSDKASAQMLIAQMKKDYAIDWIYSQCDQQLIVEGEKTNVNIRENEEDYLTSGALKTVSGRFPRNNNEAVISTVLRNRYNKDVGDYIAIKGKDGKDYQFLISGVISNNNGVNIIESGMKIINPDFELNEVYIRLKGNHDKVDEIIDKMKSRYTGYEEISNQRQETMDTVNTISSVFSAISKLILILTVIMIGFITLLIMKITIYSESRELGIFKAVGFSSIRIRLQLALRFVFITLIGGILGTLLEYFFGSRLLSMALESKGLGGIAVLFNPVTALILVASISFIALAAAYLSSGNTKRVSPYALINE